MKTSKTITLQGQKVEITKIKIGQFGDLMLAIDKLPAIVGEVVTVEELENLDAQLVFQKLPTLLSKAQTEIFKLVEVASGYEDIQNLDFEEFFDLVIAIIELNNITGIVNKVKNLGKLVKNKAK